jgi:dTDP-4-amino-4,6-dideoxygalactose transaminase
MMGALPPVWRSVPRIRLLRQGSSFDRSKIFPGRDLILFDSGTSALAVALSTCLAERNRSGAEVIVPAYGCGDLVAACLRAGAVPRLVDVAPDGSSYDRDALRDALSFDTAAVVAVNFLGLGDDAEVLAPLIAKFGAMLVQDSALHLPRTEQVWYGRFVVLSFGRGKPLNLLRGGALVGSAESLERSREALSAMGSKPQLVKEYFLTSGAAGRLFSIATNPLLYKWVSRLPGLKVGDVRYVRKRAIYELPPGAWSRVVTAFDDFSFRRSYDAGQWNESIARLEVVGIQPLRGVGRSSIEQLRLALLAPDVGARNSLVQTLNARGLGASKMYGAPMNLLQGMPSQVASQGPFPNAMSVGDRLFTLPTHLRVNAEIVKEAEDCIRRVMLERAARSPAREGLRR